MPPGSREGFSTTPDIKKSDNSSAPQLPTTFINPEMFKKFAAGDASYGRLVRSVYHESVHIRLRWGKEKDFPKVYMAGEGIFYSEVVAFYKMLKNTSLPPMSMPGEKCKEAIRGYNNYNNLKQKSVIDGLKFINDYFIKVIGED